MIEFMNDDVNNLIGAMTQDINASCVSQENLFVLENWDKVHSGLYDMCKYPKQSEKIENGIECRYLVALIPISVLERPEAMTEKMAEEHYSCRWIRYTLKSFGQEWQSVLIV